MKNIFKAHTFQAVNEQDTMTNHDRFLEFQKDIASGMKQTKKHRNQRRNLRKKLI
jgi:hypothetical protein